MLGFLLGKDSSKDIWIPITVVLVAVAIFVLSGVLFAWFIWNVKQKRTTATVISQVNNAYHRKLYNTYMNHYHKNAHSHHNLLEKTLRF